MLYACDARLQYQRPICRIVLQKVQGIIIMHACALSSTASYHHKIAQNADGLHGG